MFAARTLVAALVAALILCTPFAGTAQETAPATQAAQAGILFTGQGGKAVLVTAERLAALPAVDRDVAFMTSKGESRGRYAGPLLWTVLEEAGLLAGLAHNGELSHGLVVTGRDGYAVLLSVGEIAPDFGAVPAMIALRVDGVPSTEGLRLVVPGDRRGARAVRDVVSIALR